MQSSSKSIKAYWTDIPVMVKRFLKKALLLIVIWKLGYNLYLKPHRTLDRPLTGITTQVTIAFLKPFYSNDVFSWSDAYHMENGDTSSAIIYVNGKRSLGIGDPCNAMELIILYCGFIICMPTTFKRMFFFIVAGVLGIFVLNIFRCSAMFWFNLNNKEWFHFAHHYLFRIIVYAAIFFGWVLYCKKVNYEE